MIKGKLSQLHAQLSMNFSLFLFFFLSRAPSCCFDGCIKYWRQWHTECAVCLEPGSCRESRQVICANNHWLHKDCVRQLVRSGHWNCPICRTPFPVRLLMKYVADRWQRHTLRTVFAINFQMSTMMNQHQHRSLMSDDRMV